MLDIVPTYDMWHGIDAQLAYRIWHWTFLALPAPFPEKVIGRDPVAFWDRKSAPGTKAKIARRSIRARSRITTRSSRTRCASTRPARTIAPAAPPT